MDEKRIKSIKNYITKSVHIEQNVQPIVNTCLVGMLKAAENIDPQKVSPARTSVQILRISCCFITLL